MAASLLVGIQSREKISGSEGGRIKMLEDDVKGKARRWAELMFEASFILPADRASKGLLIISLVAAGYQAGYAEGYEVARRQKEEDENI